MARYLRQNTATTILIGQLFSWADSKTLLSDALGGNENFDPTKIVCTLTQGDTQNVITLSKSGGDHDMNLVDGGLASLELTAGDVAVRGDMSIAFTNATEGDEVIFPRTFNFTITAIPVNSRAPGVLTQDEASTITIGQLFDWADSKTLLFDALGGNENFDPDTIVCTLSKGVTQSTLALSKTGGDNDMNLVAGGMATLELTAADKDTLDDLIITFTNATVGQEVIFPCAFEFTVIAPVAEPAGPQIPAAAAAAASDSYIQLDDVPGLNGLSITAAALNVGNNDFSVAIWFRGNYSQYTRLLSSLNSGNLGWGIQLVPGQPDYLTFYLRSDFLTFNVVEKFFETGINSEYHLLIGIADRTGAHQIFFYYDNELIGVADATVNLAGLDAPLLVADNIRDAMAITDIRVIDTVGVFVGRVFSESERNSLWADGMGRKITDADFAGISGGYSNFDDGSGTPKMRITSDGVNFTDINFTMNGDGITWQPGGIPFNQRVYKGQDGVINDSEIVAIMNESEPSVTIPDQALPANTIWHYVRRNVSECGLESADSTPCIIRIDASGEMIGNTPNPPVDLTIEQLAGGVIKLKWRYTRLDEEISPSGFNIYMDSGSGFDFDTPAACIAYGLGGSGEFSWTSEALYDGQLYRFAVRSVRSGFGESQNTNFVAAKADSQGPAAITGLFASVQEI